MGCSRFTGFRHSLKKAPGQQINALESSWQSLGTIEELPRGVLTVFPPSLTLPSDPNNTGGNTDKLLTAELRASLPALYSQEKTKDPVVHCKFFTPWSNWTWFVTEGTQEDDEFLFFGDVIGLEEEWRSARVFTPDK